MANETGAIPDTALRQDHAFKAVDDYDTRMYILPYLTDEENREKIIAEHKANPRSAATQPGHPAPIYSQPLARLIDKGRALNSDTLGDYWYGQDSGVDRGVLEFLNTGVDEFTAALKECAGDEAVVEWLGERLAKPQDEIDKFNQEMRLFGPSNERQWKFLRGVIKKLDPSRTDIESFLALTVLDDQVSFARSKSSV